MSRATLRVSLLAVCMAMSFGAFAQNITGSITGTVHDPSGAIVRGADVTIINTDTGLEVRKVKTDDSGIYTAPLLPIGHYVVQVNATGFGAQKITGIDLHVNDQLKYDVGLKLASAGEQVTVEAEALQVQTQNATASGLINGTQIRELALNNRNYEQLVALQPGVTYGGATDQIYVGVSVPGGATNTVSFSINGQRNSQNNWTVDGADNVDRGSNLTLLTYPSVDAIAEFKVLRSNYNAEFGRAAGGMINVVTKSGTNHFHGSAYEFWRNDLLNANTYFNKLTTTPTPRPPLRYNDFGGTIGGPVKLPGVHLDKTFFFFSEEARRIITYAGINGWEPTSAQLNGQFTKPVCTAFNSAGTCTATGTTVTNIDPVAQAYIKDVFSKLPAPNLPSSGPNALFTQVRNVFNTRQELLRLDHTIGERLALAFRWENDTIPTIEPGGLFTGAGLPAVSTTKTNSPGQSYLGRFTYTATPTLLFDGGYVYSYGAITSDPIGLIASANSPDVKVALPFSSTLARIPSLTFSGVTFGSASVTSFGQYRDYNRNHNVFGNVTKVMGNHAMKYGVTYNHYQKTENNGGTNQGTFGFTNAGAPSGTANFDQAFANFLTGNVQNFSQGSIDVTPDVRTSQWEAYGQDEWKVKSNLTLTYGVRYSYFGQPYDARHMLTNFDPALFNASNVATINAAGSIVGTNPNPLNGVIINGQNSPFGSRVGQSEKTNFAPRVGLAWDIFGNGKTAFRTGYGISYDSTLFGIYEQNIFQNPPFVQSISVLNTTFANPGGGTLNVSSTPLALRGTSVSGATPYTEMYNVDIQQEFVGNTILDIGWYGDHGVHQIGIADINQPKPGAYYAAIGATPTTPFLTSAQDQRINSIRPYVGFGPINQIVPWFGSNYNSLQTSLQKKLRGNSLVSVSYTWSHGLTDMQTDRSTAPQNTYCSRCEYGPTQIDRRHVLTANWVYDLPFFAKQQGFVGHVLGGWEYSGIFSGATGLPLTVTGGSSIDPAGQGVKLSASAAGYRPDLIADPNAGAPHSFGQWFNTAAFADVPTGQFRPGNEHRGAVIGPGYYKFDMSLFKNVKFTESTSLQFRAEAFNVFNHTNFQGVNTTFVPGSTSFGKINSTRDPRIMQLALKFYF